VTADIATAPILPRGSRRFQGPGAVFRLLCGLPRPGRLGGAFGGWAGPSTGRTPGAPVGIVAVHGVLSDPVIKVVPFPEPVTNQVTTTSGNDGPSPTYSDARMSLACDNTTQHDANGRNWHAW
jgi:hypothetical protein